MKIALALGFVAMTFVAILLLASRINLARSAARLARVEEEAFEAGLAED